MIDIPIIEIYCNNNFGCAEILAGYLNFYSKRSIQLIILTNGLQEIHPLSIQVMMEDGIDISVSVSQLISNQGKRKVKKKIIIKTELIEPELFENNTHYYKVNDPFISTKYDEIVIGFRAMREELKKMSIAIIGELES